MQNIEEKEVYCWNLFTGSDVFLITCITADSLRKTCCGMYENKISPGLFIKQRLANHLMLPNGH